jgi:hypothetical protein
MRWCYVSSTNLNPFACLLLTEVFIVAPKEYEGKLSHFLGEYTRNSMSIDLVAIDDMYGSADCLRAVKDRIRGDFFCLNSDFISQYCIGELANMHRLSTSDLSMMLTTASSDVKKDEVDEEFIGICDDGRVVMKMPTLEIDETIELTKPLLHRAPGLSLRQDLVDVGIYLMSHWVLEFLTSNSKITSIRTDLLPYLINRQHQPADVLLKLIPSLEHRNRPLKAVEPWIVSATACDDEDKGQAILDTYFAEEESPSGLHGNSPVPGRSQLDTSLDGEGKGKTGASGAHTQLLEGSADLLRCYALVYEPPARVEVAGAVSNISLLGRVVNIPTYLNLNK